MNHQPVTSYGDFVLRKEKVIPLRQGWHSERFSGPGILSSS
jgi:hypothetical protein